MTTVENFCIPAHLLVYFTDEELGVPQKGYEEEWDWDCWDSQDTLTLK